MSLNRKRALEVVDALQAEGIWHNTVSITDSPNGEGEFCYVETQFYAELSRYSMSKIINVVQKTGAAYRIYVLDGTTGPKGRLSVQFHGRSA